MAKKTCPTCGQPVCDDPRIQLIAHLNNKIKASATNVGEAERASSKDDYPGRLLESRQRTLAKYRRWLAVVNPEAPETEDTGQGVSEDGVNAT